MGRRRKILEMNTERKLELFPDGTPIADWFYDVKEPVLEEMGKKYVLTHYGGFDDGKVHRHFALLYDHPVYPA